MNDELSLRPDSPHEQARGGLSSLASTILVPNTIGLTPSLQGFWIGSNGKNNQGAKAMSITAEKNHKLWATCVAIVCLACCSCGGPGQSSPVGTWTHRQIRIDFKENGTVQANLRDSRFVGRYRPISSSGVKKYSLNLRREGSLNERKMEMKFISRNMIRVTQLVDTQQQKSKTSTRNVRIQTANG